MQIADTYIVEHYNTGEGRRDDAGEGMIYLNTWVLRQRQFVARSGFFSFSEPLHFLTHTRRIFPFYAISVCLFHQMGLANGLKFGFTLMIPLTSQFSSGVYQPLERFIKLTFAGRNAVVGARTAQ